MECKSKSKPFALLIFSELIDTLWNVNTVNSCSSPSIVTELIDTLWNVNIEGI